MIVVTSSLEVVMPTDDDKQRAEALRQIADANAVLARLQRERFNTLSKSCLPAFELLRDRRDATPFSSNFAVNSLLLKLISGESAEVEFTDSESAYELEQAAESFSRQLRLHRKRLERDFDVFLSYNSEDRGEVRTIARQLRMRGLLPWFDEEALRPGEAWPEKLQHDIQAVKSCAVIVGHSGLGPWQRREVAAALQLFVERGQVMVPVLLPSCGTVPDLPLFLRAVGWVDYRSLDPDPVEQLVDALAGQRGRLTSTGADGA